MKANITMKDIIRILLYALFAGIFAYAFWFVLCYTLKNWRFIYLAVITTFAYGEYCAIKDIVNLLIRIARR